MQAGKEFVVLDAGHINYDVALYSIKSTSPLQFKEKGGNSPGSELISVIFRGPLLKAFVVISN